MQTHPLNPFGYNWGLSAEKMVIDWNRSLKLIQRPILFGHQKIFEWLFMKVSTFGTSWLVVPLRWYMSHCICVAGMEAMGNQRREDGWVRWNSQTNDACTRNECSYYQRLAVTLSHQHTIACCTQPAYTFMFCSLRKLFMSLFTLLK